MAEGTHTQRRLAAILAADVVGYSSMMATDEVGTRQIFNRHFNELLVPTIASRGGRIFKTMGDGLLAEFVSVVEAVGCAESIQSSMIDRNSEHPENQQFVFRMGVNLGDVIVEDDDIHGDGVNIAARLEAIADPGSVYISSDVYRQVSGTVSGTVTPLGEQSLKNIDRPVSVYRLELSTTADPDRFHTGVQRPPAASDRPSIAVLPFRNRSEDRDGDYFAEGISEDIITALSHVGWLFVIARSTSFVFTASDRDPRLIAAELGVAYILDGSVRRAGDRVRVSTELVEGPTGRQMWSKRYDREFSDIFEIQDEISEAIVGEIQPELARSEQDRALQKRGENLRAWDIHQRAIWHSWRRTHDDLDEAIRLFGAARIEDPSFAQAYAGEAEALCFQFIRGYSQDDQDALTRALELSRRAAALDPHDAFTHYALGRTLMFLRRHGEAEPELRMALEINPNYAHAVFALGNTLATSGRAPEGIDLIERAMRLSPRDHQIGQMMTRLAEALLFVGKYDDAFSWSRRSLQQPNIQPSRWTTLLAILGHLGRLEEIPPVLSALRDRDVHHTIDFVKRRYPIIDEGYMSILVDGLRKAGLS